ncbi:MFS transporter [Sphingomonas lenta]|uniref:MFS transporter n=1 Tax=Sphingomonas lenta TaxID=1141887 RepID=UPI0015956DC9|nr:MFS transporter [Sphingomonas lenta]
MLFCTGFLNYLDRQTLSILKATLKSVFDFDDSGYSTLIAAFMVPYIIMYVVGGRIVDRFGSRLSMTVFIASWSVANALGGLAQSLGQLGGARALLGAAEAGTFPAFQRAIISWVPSERRAFAMSLVAPSTTLGAVAAPPLIAALTLHLSWRGAFILPGVLGLLLALAWWFADRGAPAEAEIRESGAASFGEVLRERRLWGVVAARGLSDPVWYFHLFWIPGYLQERLGLSLAQLGAVGWIPTVTASVICIAAAHLTDQRVARGRDPISSRLLFFYSGAVLAPIGALTTLAPNLAVALLLITIVTVACQLWFFGTGPLLADMLPARINASAFGVIGAFGASTGLILNFAAGPIIEQLGYAVVFGGLALLHPIAALVLWLSIVADRRRTADRGEPQAVG